MASTTLDVAHNAMIAAVPSAIAAGFSSTSSHALDALSMISSAFSETPLDLACTATTGRDVDAVWRTATGERMAALQVLNEKKQGRLWGKKKVSLCLRGKRLHAGPLTHLSPPSQAKIGKNKNTKRQQQQTRRRPCFAEYRTT